MQVWQQAGFPTELVDAIVAAVEAKAFLNAVMGRACNPGAAPAGMGAAAAAAGGLLLWAPWPHPNALPH
jgi:hypothetical protein